MTLHDLRDLTDRLTTAGSRSELITVGLARGRPRRSSRPEPRPPWTHRRRPGLPDRGRQFADVRTDLDDYTQAAQDRAGTVAPQFDGNLAEAEDALAELADTLIATLSTTARDCDDPEVSRACSRAALSAADAADIRPGGAHRDHLRRAHCHRRRHLEAVSEADLRGYTDAESLQLLAEVARCLRSCQLLWRTIDREDRRFCDPDQAWQRAGNTLDRALTDATRHLMRWTTSIDVRTAPREAARLHAASVAIGASHDLLATHTGQSRRGPVDLTGLAAVIDSPDGRRALAAITAGHIGQLLEITDQVSANENARRTTREAALRCGDMLHSALRPSTAPSTSAAPTPSSCPRSRSSRRYACAHPRRRTP